MSKRHEGRGSITTKTEEILQQLREAKNRYEAAGAYANGVAAHSRRVYLNWPTINRYIVNRWSKSGLIFIKREAWKLIEAVECGDYEVVGG